MSNYRDFVSDFPNRCSDLLRRFYKPAKHSDREVTLLLTIATSGLVVPFERLRPSANGELNHPLSDPTLHNSASKHLDQLMSQPFLASRLASSTNSWTCFKRSVDKHEMPDQWEDLHLPQKPMSHEKTCGSVLKLLRNALAHGNIFSTGIKIDRLVFLASLGDEPEHLEREDENRILPHARKFNVLVVSPNDFHQFLLNWFDYLAEIRIPGGIEETANV